MFFFRSSISALPRAVTLAALARAATKTISVSPGMFSLDATAAQTPDVRCVSLHGVSDGSAGLFAGTRTLLAPKRKPANTTKPKATRTSKKSKATATPTSRKAKAAPVKARAPRRARQTATNNNNNNTAAASTNATSPAAPPADSLAAFSPAIASTWLAAASSKMLQPQHVTPRSRKLAWWVCPSCQNQFNRRIDLNVAAGGGCPQCHAKPSTAAANGHKKSTLTSGDGLLVSTPSASGAATATSMKHRCRPDNARTTLAADNANRIKKSVADASYLRTVETRNLQPMLAKNFTNESKKIGEDEVVWVSPKLDGIRCVVSYDQKNKSLLFFSRAGTLFECCDAKIEPTLRPLFEANPYLVLDGELYNDSVNLTKMQATSTGKSASKFASSLPSASSSSSSGGEVIDFQALTSAIRTTRDRCTPEAAALQARLQYHVFDVLHTAAADGTSSLALSSTPYSARYALLQSVFEALAKVPQDKAPAGFDSSSIRLVPSLPFLKSEIDDALNSAIAYGYEGVMVRRDHVSRSRGRSSSSSSASRRRRGALSDSKMAQRISAHGLVKSAAANVKVTPMDALSTRADSTGGYGFGQRSSTLLKYKRMQDAEYVIVGAVEGKGKWKDSLGAFVCTTKDGNHVFTVTPASTDEQKRQMWASWKTAYKGKALTVQFQELTTDGVPRFPIGKSVRGAANGSDWI